VLTLKIMQAIQACCFQVLSLEGRASKTTKQFGLKSPLPTNLNRCLLQTRSNAISADSDGRNCHDNYIGSNDRKLNKYFVQRQTGFKYEFLEHSMTDSFVILF